MRAYLAGSKVDKNGNMFTPGALEKMAVQMKSMPITLGFDFGKDDSIGVVTKGYVKDGNLYVEGTIDAKWVGRFLSPCVVLEDVEYKNKEMSVKKCRLASVFPCNEHADREATPIEETEEGK